MNYKSLSKVNKVTMVSMIYDFCFTPVQVQTHKSKLKTYSYIYVALVIRLISIPDWNAMFTKVRQGSADEHWPFSDRPLMVIGLFCCLLLSLCFSLFPVSVPGRGQRTWLAMLVSATCVTSSNHSCYESLVWTPLLCQIILFPIAVSNML